MRKFRIINYFTVSDNIVKQQILDEILVFDSNLNY